MLTTVLTHSFYYKLKQATLMWVVALTCVLASITAYLVLFKAPLDYQQKETVRIMYLHVPASWLALALYGFMGLMALCGFIWRSSLSFYYARAAAPIGLCFTLVSLLTGSIWGKPMWGTWWVWDARLTSMALLALLYAGYLLLVTSHTDAERAHKMGAVIALLGLINLPIIKFSVDWWSTLHQPASILRAQGPAIHASMLYPLCLSALTFCGFSYILVLLRVETLLMTQKVHRALILKTRLEA
jgi:heme exporter protein C